MRHLKQGRKLGRTTAHRKALLRNLATALLEHERIITTEPKAKELRRVADKLVTLGKRGNLHARRQALQTVQSNAVVQKLFNEIAPRFAERQGGYTRIIRLGYRPGDAAAMAVIELVDAQSEEA
jgi:large subunit ribosomal protein L17